MKFLLRSLLTVLLVIIIFLSGFYFWASSPTGLTSEYSRIVEFDGITGYRPSDTLSVMTYNIGYLSGMTNNRPVDTTQTFFQENLDRVQYMFRQLSPSFTAFQEVDFYSQRSYFMNQFDSLAHSTGYGYGAYAINWDKQYVPFPYWPFRVHFGKMLSGQGVLSSFPVIENRRIVLSKPEDNPFFYNAFYLDRLIQVCKINVNEDTLILINVHLEAFDQETREKQSRTLKALITDYMENPLILAGDFNPKNS